MIFQLIIGELFIGSEIIYIFVLDLLVPKPEIENKILRLTLEN